MFEQIEMWPARDYNSLETPNLEPPEPEDDPAEEYEDGYDYDDDGAPLDDFDFEMPTDDGAPE